MLLPLCAEVKVFRVVLMPRMALVHECCLFYCTQMQYGNKLTAYKLQVKENASLCCFALKCVEGLKQIEEISELLFSSNEDTVMLGSILFPNEMLQSTEAVGC